MDIHLGLSEHITVGVERTALTKVVVTTATAEDITVYVSLKERYIGLACLVDTPQLTYGIMFTAGIDDTTTNSSDLTATEECIAHMTAVHLDIGDVYVTVVNISTTEDTAAIV